MSDNRSINIETIISAFKIQIVNIIIALIVFSVFLLYNRINSMEIINFLEDAIKSRVIGL